MAIAKIASLAGTVIGKLNDSSRVFTLICTGDTQGKTG